MKRCARCYEDKPLDDFARHVGNPDGLQRWCRACNADEKKAYGADGHGRHLIDDDPFGRFARIEVCICPVAVQADPDSPHTSSGCADCGCPIVAHMAPRLRAEMARKYPPILNQTVINPDMAEATA